jgi:hypothetical protein
VGIEGQELAEHWLRGQASSSRKHLDMLKAEQGVLVGGCDGGTSLRWFRFYWVLGLWMQVVKEGCCGVRS